VVNDFLNQIRDVSDTSEANRSPREQALINK